MEQSFLEALRLGAIEILHSVNTKFLVLFIVIMFLFNEAINHPELCQWLNWLQKVPTSIRVFVSGILLAIIFALLEGYRDADNIRKLFYAIVVGMVIWKLGVSYLFDAIKQWWNKLWSKVIQ